MTRGMEADLELSALHPVAQKAEKCQSCRVMDDRGEKCQRMPDGSTYNSSNDNNNVWVVSWLSEGLEDL